MTYLPLFCVNNISYTGENLSVNNCLFYRVISENIQICRQEIIVTDEIS